MNIKANAKINLSLDIIGTDERGYHKLRMLMQSISLCDEIELARTSEPGIHIQIQDERGMDESDRSALPSIPTDKRNLMYRAAELMTNRCGINDGIDMKLIKRIPSEAGLAGGSTDAAAVLKGMNELFGLKLSEHKLRELGVSLGADIPFCIVGGTALAEGIGEKLTAIDNKCSLHVLLIKPKQGISTPMAYAEYDRLNAASSAKEHTASVDSENTKASNPLSDSLNADNDINAAQQKAYITDTASTQHEHVDTNGLISALENGDCTAMFRKIKNVLETPVINKLPLIDRIKADLTAYGADASLMTGSGSAVYGLFIDDESMHQAAGHFRECAYIDEISDIIEAEFV